MALPARKRLAAWIGIVMLGGLVPNAAGKFGRSTGSVAIDDSGVVKQSQTAMHYSESSFNRSERGRIFHVTSGANDVVETATYGAEAGGGEKVELHDDVRAITTEEHYDARDLLIQRLVKDSNGDLAAEESFGYDASGQLSYAARRQTGVGLVESTTTYDPMGRVVATTLTKAMVDGSPATIRTRTLYELANNRITVFDPYIGVEEIKTTTTLDGLGRTIRSERQAVAGGDVIRGAVAYDLQGQVSWESDTVRTAIARRHDIFGREVASVTSDGISSEPRWDAWGQLREVITRSSNLAPLSRSFNTYTLKGRLRATNDEITPNGPARQTRFQWSEGDRVTSVRTGEVASVYAPNISSSLHRTRRTTRDAAGRAAEEAVGEAEGIGSDILSADLWSKVTYSYLGSLPNVVTSFEPRVGASYATITTFDALGRPKTTIEPGIHTTESEHDEAGNLVSIKRPGLDAESASFDSRGLATELTLSDGKKQRLVYDARGMLREYRDEETTSQVTKYTPDALGRPMKTEYEDDTYEEVVYENVTGLVRAQRDRAGQWTSFTYDNGGRVKEVHAGDDPASGVVLVRYDYDPGGRLSLVRNRDAGIEYADYDLLGRPHTTRTYRYLGGSGTDPIGPAIGDVHTQKHDWSIDDERTLWSMPVAGRDVPAVDPVSPWLQSIAQSFDGGGNLEQQSTAAGAVLSRSDGRATGRLDLRKRITANGTEIATQFGFADGLPVDPNVELPGAGASAPITGLPRWNRTSVGSETRAGNLNQRDAARRLGILSDLASDRRSAWSYDRRGRLETTQLGVATLATPALLDGFTAGDFRELRDPASLVVTTAGVGPLKWTATQEDAHQIATRTLYRGNTPEPPLTYSFVGGRRTNDGVWTYTFDELGRMKAAERMVPPGEKRRIEFEWDPNDRLIGRTAFEPDGNGGWRIETRAAILGRDALPAESTLVWDPLTDRLVAVFTAGASTQQGASPTAGLVRQYLHGDQGYDDPTEVRIAGANGTPQRFYPVIDHAGTGSLQATIGADGNLVERVLYADTFGDAPRYLQAAVADKITLQTTKDAQGNVTEVKVRVHLSEQIDSSTLDIGARLASVKDDKTVAQLSSVTPQLEDKYTILWSLSQSEWNALVAAPGATKLEVSLTTALRFKGWGNVPVSKVPGWALARYTGTDATDAQPVIYRESLTSIGSMTGTGETASTTPFEIPSLYLAASDESRVKLLTGFKAAPFVEPATGLVYLRDRWYDPATGTWLTPDAYGTIDSSNLYAYCANDPVNCSDPMGTFGWDPAKWGHAIDDAYAPIRNSTANRALKVFAPYASMDAGVDTAVDFLTLFERPGTLYAEQGMSWRTSLAFVGDTSKAFLYGVGMYGAVASRIPSLSARTASVASGVATDSGELVGSGSYKGRTRFDASNLTAEEVDKAILKSIRRKSGATGTSSGEIAATADQTEFILQKVTSWRRNVHAANVNLSALPSNLKGTLLHSSVQSRLSQLNIRGLAVNQRLYGTSQFTSPNTGLPYEYRIPDFRSPTTIFDIKPFGTPLAGPQYIDFMQFSGLSDIRWIYYAPY